MNEEENLIFEFNFTDEFGQKISYKRELTLANQIEGGLDLMVEQFKCFLLAQGYLQEQVDKIYLKD